jgi:hypothetical protein
MATSPTPKVSFSPRDDEEEEKSSYGRGGLAPIRTEFSERIPNNMDSVRSEVSGDDSDPDDIKAVVKTKTPTPAKSRRFTMNSAPDLWAKIQEEEVLEGDGMGGMKDEMDSKIQEMMDSMEKMKDFVLEEREEEMDPLDPERLIAQRSMLYIYIYIYILYCIHMIEIYINIYIILHTCY